MEPERSSYPIKTATQLAYLISESWGINVNAEAISKPTPETVQSIYCAIIADMLNIDVQSFESQRIQVTVDMEYQVSVILSITSYFF